jgi:transposase InsO family protein
VHVCVDDATLGLRRSPERRAGDHRDRFLSRAIAFYAAHGVTVERVMTDNGSAYRSTIHAFTCRALGVRHLRTRPYRPRTNGKAERFIRTLLAGWAHGTIYGTSRERAAAHEVGSPMRERRSRTPAAVALVIAGPRPR